MTFRSVAEVLEIIGGTHTELVQEVEGLADEQLHFRPSDDCWTIAEIVEHVAIVQEGMGKITSKLVREAEAAGKQASPDRTFEPVSTGFVPSRSSLRLQAPSNVRPVGGIPIPTSLDKLRIDYDRIREMRPRIEAVDIGAFTFPHPAFGALTGYQWLGLLGVHENRHIEQIREIKSAAGFPPA
ncbi:MAG: DinB family protein [Acidobacteriota bacterium]